MDVILLDNLISGTSSNSEGEKLQLVLDNYLLNSSQVILNVSSKTALSTSFLNSSMGILIDKYGIERFKNAIKFKSNKAQFQRISNYIEKYSRIYA